MLSHATHFQIEPYPYMVSENWLEPFLSGFEPRVVMSRLGSVRLGSAHVSLTKLGEPSHAKPWLAI